MKSDVLLGRRVSQVRSKTAIPTSPLHRRKLKSRPAVTLESHPPLEAINYPFEEEQEGFESEIISHRELLDNMVS
jgi:hypothetical protein